MGNITILNFDNSIVGPIAVGLSQVEKIAEYKGDDRIPATILLYLKGKEVPGILTGDNLATLKSWWPGDVSEVSRLDILLVL